MEALHLPFSASLPIPWWAQTLLALSCVIWTLLKRVNNSWSKLAAPSQVVPPGSLGWPVIGETFQFMAAAANSKSGFYHFVQARRLKYGACFKTKVFGKTQVFISSLEATKAVLGNERGRFTKSYMKSMAELVGKHSILCASHQTHKVLRNMLTPLFSTHSIASVILSFDKATMAELKRWPLGDGEGTVFVLQEALKITFRAIIKMLLGIEEEEEVRDLEGDVGFVYEAMLAFPLRLPWTRFHKGLQAREKLMKKLDNIIGERRRKTEEKKEDFLQHLLFMKGNGEGEDDDESNSLTDEQIKDNILTLIIAGQDTTATAIAWMIKYLDENEEVLYRLKIEQKLVQEKVSTKEYLSLEDLNLMPYATKVVKESLRMASIVPWFPRVALQDCQVEGFSIKKGWTVNVDAKSIHFDTQVHHEPHKFNPSRFDDDAKLKPYSFLAFGTGGRTCLGLNLAKAMMLVFLHRLLTTYQWEVIDKDSSVKKWTLFSRLNSGCPIRIARSIGDNGH